MTIGGDDPGLRSTSEDEELEQQSIPRWVPILIGLVLVALAALAVYTGVRYRMNPLAVTTRGEQAASGSRSSPPGEPQPGASLVFPGGERGDNVPQANTPVTGNARAVVTGGAGGVNAVVRIWARRGMIIESDPANAMISVNGLPVGEAVQFDTTDEIYDFAAAGSYNVKVSAPGYADRSYVVTATEDAQDDVAIIRVKLERPR